MPDEPSGAVAVIVATALGLVFLASIAAILYGVLR